MDALQVVSQPHRREILRLVWDRERSAGEIAARFDLTFGAVSQHLGVLRGAGFVRARRHGNRRPYQADPAALGPLATVLEAMCSEALGRQPDRAARLVDGRDRAQRRRRRDTRPADASRLAAPGATNPPRGLELLPPAPGARGDGWRPGTGPGSRLSGRSAVRDVGACR